MTLTTTFALLRANDACAKRYRHLAKALGGIKHYGENTPITLEKILELNGVDDVIWAFCSVPVEQVAERDKVARLFACDCAEHVLPIWQEKYPNDTRPATCIAVARRYAVGDAQQEELYAARYAAMYAAGSAAGSAARYAAMYAARDAAMYAAMYAARDAAMDAAGGAEQSWQSAKLAEYLSEVGNEPSIIDDCFPSKEE